MELTIGTLVMVRDPWIVCEAMIPPARIVKIENNNFLLEWNNGLQYWFDKFSLKTK